MVMKPAGDEALRRWGAAFKRYYILELLAILWLCVPDDRKGTKGWKSELLFLTSVWLGEFMIPPSTTLNTAGLEVLGPRMGSKSFANRHDKCSIKS